MPSPWSSTSNRTLSCCGCARTTTVLPGALCRTALPIRLSRTSAIRSASANTGSTGSPTSAASWIFAADAAAARFASAPSTRDFDEMAAGCTSTLPAWIRARSSRSSTMSWRRSQSSRAACSRSACFSLTAPTVPSRRMWIGKAVDGRLRCLLRLEKLPERAAAILAQLVGHGVELASDLRDLVLSLDARPRLEIAFPDAPHRQAEPVEWPQRPPGERYGGEETEHQRADGGEQEQRAISFSGGASVVALQQHRVLVDHQDPLRRVLEPEEFGLQLLEVVAAQLLFPADPAECEIGRASCRERV